MKVDRRRLLQAMSVCAALAPVLSLNSAFASEGDSSGQEASPAAKFVQMDPNVSFDKQVLNNNVAAARTHLGAIASRDRGELPVHELRHWESTDAFKTALNRLSFRPSSSNILQERRFRLLCFRGWRCRECVWVSRSHRIRFYRWSVRTWRKHGETVEQEPKTCFQFVRRRTRIASGIRAEERLSF